MPQTEGHTNCRTVSVANSSCHGPSTCMLPSPGPAKSDAQNTSGSIISKPPTRKTTFLDLPQELKDMIWKEALLEEDNVKMYSGCHVSPEQAFFQRLPQHGPIFVFSRPSAIAHLCHDARAAALKHCKRDSVRNDSPALREGLNNLPWLSKSALLVPKSYQKLGYGVLPDDLQRDPFKSYSVLLDASMLLDTSFKSRWWEYRFQKIMQNHRQTRVYDFLQNARDDQVMVTSPELIVHTDFTPSRWSRCKFLACQIPGCNDDQIFAVLSNPELDWDTTFTYRDIYVDVQDHDMLWCILNAARHFFLQGYPGPEQHGSLDDRAFIQEMAKNTLKSLQDLWVQKSWELLGEEKVMPRVRPVIKIRITIEAGYLYGEAGAVDH